MKLKLINTRCLFDYIVKEKNQLKQEKNENAEITGKEKIISTSVGL